MVAMSEHALIFVIEGTSFTCTVVIRLQLSILLAAPLADSEIDLN